MESSALEQLVQSNNRLLFQVSHAELQLAHAAKQVDRLIVERNGLRLALASIQDSLKRCGLTA